ncbi:uncharacterized protein MYCFIDRAFT_171462 [Pseudocercospora fijiensis CIRAD86]|uniref:PNPLA domain-containing protein n=1 Tax=Pseudocercospora fijiensis (strain CIRAD86) TaxID=383855 RepID=M2Z6Z0_PSEFD|nr:uncharacterized protein MYCFIDRAFT_171462 [Pseudocercospora fijiensis CIRAD86]EME85555.1 hypothetical protein MYCFIDRAFT_171462 [Pseudocercospora fijiensis CIRAD86]
MSAGIENPGLSSLIAIVVTTHSLWKDQNGDTTDVAKDLWSLQAVLEKFERINYAQAIQCIGESRLRETVQSCSMVVKRLRKTAHEHFGRNHGMRKRIPRRLEEDMTFREGTKKLKAFVCTFQAFYETAARSGPAPRPQGLNAGSIPKRSTWSNNDNPSARPTSPPIRDDPWQGQIVLSLDGSDLRGFAILIVLRVLLEEIEDQEILRDPWISDSYSSPRYQVADEDTSRSRKGRPSYDHFRPCHYFDYICGSGTGGIAAVMLGTMRYSIHDTIDVNTEIWSEISPGLSRVFRSMPQIPTKSPKSQNSLAMMDSLRRALDAPDAHRMRADEGKCQSIVYVAYKPRKGIMQSWSITSFEPSAVERQRRQAVSQYIDTDNILVIDACRATSAAPKLFKKVELDSVKHGSFRDGGLYRSNPAEDVYREINTRHRQDGSTVKALLSIGGRTARSFSEEDDRMLREWQRIDSFDYDRIPCATSGKSLRSIEEQAESLCQEGMPIRSTLRKWAILLVDIRHERCRTSRWETYAGLSASVEPLFPLETAQDTREFAEQMKWSGIDAMMVGSTQRTY